MLQVLEQAAMMATCIASTIIQRAPLRPKSAAGWRVATAEAVWRLHERTNTCYYCNTNGADALKDLLPEDYPHLRGVSHVR